MTEDTWNEFFAALELSYNERNKLTESERSAAFWNPILASVRAQQSGTGYSVAPEQAGVDAQCRDEETRFSQPVKENSSC
jgi:hypothetical protein